MRALRTSPPCPTALLGHSFGALVAYELDARYGGSPDEVKAVPEFLAMMLPVLRADMAAFEDHHHAPGPLLRCPIVACRGRDDRTVEPARPRRWGELTECAFEARAFPGGHFFAYDPASGFLAMVRERLDAITRQGACTGRT